MPLSRLELQAVHEAAAAAASGAAIRWEPQSVPELALDWISGGHEHRVCSALDARAFEALVEEARVVFWAEFERLKGPRKAE
jgi:hypothetical protein